MKSETEVHGRLKCGLLEPPAGTAAEMGHVQRLFAVAHIHLITREAESLRSQEGESHVRGNVPDGKHSDFRKELDRESDSGCHQEGMALTPRPGQPTP